MTYLLPVLFIVAWTAIFTRIFHHRFEACLPVSLMCVTMIVYILTYIFDFNVAFLAVVMTAVIGGCILVVQIRQGHWQQWRQELITPGLLIFLLLMGFLCWMNRNRGLMAWDETSHWAMMVKETLRINDFYCTDASVLLAHKDYPPFICLFESLYTRLSGGFREGHIYTALQMLGLSFFFPLLSLVQRGEKEPRRRCVLGTVVILILMLTSVVFCDIHDNQFYSSIYEDGILALEFSYGIFCVYQLGQSTCDVIHRRYLVTNIILVSLFLLMTKQMGIIFLGLLLLYYVVIHFPAGEGTIRRLVQEIATFLCIPLAFLISWKMRIHQYGLDDNAQFQMSDLNPLTLWTIICGEGGQEYQMLAGKNYLDALWKRELHHYGISCSYITMILIFVLLFAVTVLIFHFLHIKNSLGWTGIVLLLGAVGYAFVMLMMYTLSFGPEEGPVLASYERYMNTYLFAVWICFVLIIADTFATNLDKPWAVFGGGALALAMIGYLSVFHQWDKFQAPQMYQSVNQIYDEDASFLEDNTPSDARILFIDTTLDAYHFMYQCYALRYLTAPRTYQTQDWMSRMEHASVHEMRQELAQWDYVYFIHVDENWVNTYGTLFDEKLYDGLLYSLE